MSEREVHMSPKLWFLYLWAGLFWSVDDGRICTLARRLPRWPRTFSMRLAFLRTE